MKGTKKLDAAKKLVDWAVEQGRDEALREELRDRRACRASPKPLPNVPADYEKRLVKNDFEWAAEEPRHDPRRVEQALRRQVGAEEVAAAGAAPTDRRAGIDRRSR